MCGIAGMVDLSGRGQVPSGVLRRMADAIIHRGPDEEGYLETPRVGFANRRLSIVGLADGQQPIANEDGSVITVFNGEFFDYPEVKHYLEGRGHVFRTHTDTELIPHLWEDFQEKMFDHLRGQFALAVWDQRRRVLVLARDRFGICPVFWTRQRTGGGDWLLFASEIKALLASGFVDARPDLRGIDQAFHFFAVPGPATCFEGVQLLQPGHYLHVDLGDSGPARFDKRSYWEMDFPDRGQEERGDNVKKVVDGFEEVMLAAVERRLRADVPVVSYLSGGIDSSLVVALAVKERGVPIPTFTIQIMAPHLDETIQAAVVSKHIGAKPIIVQVGDEEVLGTYPELTRAAEAPVIDTSCTALLLLAREVHRHGYKVALTGEGSDEWLAGYPWYKVHRLFGFWDMVPGMGMMLRDMAARVMGSSHAARAHIGRIHEYLGHHSAFQDIYGLMTLARWRFLAPHVLEQLADYNPYLEMEPNFERMRKWHPLHHGLYWAGRIHLAGHLLSSKGDRVAMNSSVEARYPFLDERVFAYLAKLHPSWKLRGFKDKYVLRLLGERYLPKEVAWRAKGMFRAPLHSFFEHKVPAFVDQLLSPESLKKTGWFNVPEIEKWRQRMKRGKLWFYNRPMIELGMVGVVATQLWYHTFIDSSLAELPGGWQRPATRPQLMLV
jgi:asparagine synthase (glutamine-hydrolysing)